MSLRRSVLLVAPCLDGDDVGEAWSSYRWAEGLSELHDLTVLGYHKRGHRPITEQLPRARVVEWTDLPGVGRFERVNSMLKPAYPLFHFRARRWIRKALTAGEQFDLAHQLAPLAPRYPSPLAGLGIPWILGPLAGSLESPDGFGVGAKAPWYTKLRRFDGLRRRRDPWLRETFADANQVIGVAPYVNGLLGGLPSRPLVYESETGVVGRPKPGTRSVEGPLRMLHVGRIVRTKGLLHAIRALASLAGGDWTLDVLGEGVDEGACREAARVGGIEDQVRFHGRVPRTEVDAFYASSDLFLFPSYCEPSGNVVFEALSHGLCVVCCDRGGPGHVVRPGTGFKVPADGPVGMESALAQVLKELLGDRERVHAVGLAGQEYILEEATWSAKIRRMAALYEEVAVSA